LTALLRVSKQYKLPERTVRNRLLKNSSADGLAVPTNEGQAAIYSAHSACIVGECSPSNGRDWLSRSCRSEGQAKSQRVARGRLLRLAYRSQPWGRSLNVKARNLFKCERVPIDAITLVHRCVPPAPAVLFPSASTVMLCMSEASGSLSLSHDMSSWVQRMGFVSIKRSRPALGYYSTLRRV
jgi:hypothetical protein